MRRHEVILRHRSPCRCFELADHVVDAMKRGFVPNGIREVESRFSGLRRDYQDYPKGSVRVHAQIRTSSSARFFFALRSDNHLQAAPTSRVARSFPQLNVISPGCSWTVQLDYPKQRVEDRSPDHHLLLQQVLFPGGLRLRDGRFGAAVNCLAFVQLPPETRVTSKMASPTGAALMYSEDSIRIELVGGAVERVKRVKRASNSACEL
jgi:hypothetical protein